MYHGAKEEEFLVENLSLGVTKNGKEYANLTLRKKADSFDAKIWSWTSDMSGYIEVGKVIRVKYTQDLYQGKTQLNISSAMASRAPLDEFLQGSRFSADDMFNEIMRYKWQDSQYGKILDQVFLDECIKKDFKEHPAALKVHGSWVGGLLEHTWSMWKLAPAIVKHYQQYVPNLSLDKILFGVVVHDLGKVLEYARKNSTCVKSTEGALLGHITSATLLVDRAIEKVCPSISTEDRNEILHLIVAHHGKTEFGSPVPPATLEALIIHQLDMLDSHLVHALGMIEAGPSPENVELTQHSRYHGTQYLMRGLENAEGVTSQSDGASGGNREGPTEDSLW